MPQSVLGVRRLSLLFQQDPDRSAFPEPSKLFDNLTERTGCVRMMKNCGAPADERKSEDDYAEGLSCLRLWQMIALLRASMVLGCESASAPAE